MDCIFCKIASKKIPSTIVKETDKVIVIKDLNPQAPTHLLLIPKTHYASIMECEDRGILNELLSVARDIAGEQGVDKKGFRLVINTNEEGGQTVFHLHMHLLAGRHLEGKMG